MSVAEPLPNTLLEHALQYAEQGLEVFPCKPENKHPYPANGMKDATTNPDQIRAWWHRWPDALIACRIPENIVVLDIDPKHSGQGVWNALQETYGELPYTRRHASGRGDGGEHWWFQHPGGKLTAKKLNDWARQQGVGEPAGTRSWTAGVDILHHGHRYSILPPSPHPDTGKPYRWKVKAQPAPIPGWLAHLLAKDEPAEPALRVVKDSDGIADWYTANHSWHDILPPAGWNLVTGDGDSDGSAWRHPNATSEHSATIRHGCLFVYSPNTDFEETEEGDPNGYTRFRAWAILEHDENLTAAASAAYELRDGPRPEPRDWMPEFGDPTPTTEPDPPAAPDDLRSMLIRWDDFWAKDHKTEEWLAWPLLPKGRQVALYAPAKTGKSIITLAAVAAMATGRAIFGNPQQDPVDVLYLDYEMTESDLHERLEALGYGPDTDLSHLHYASLPSLPPLNTQAGAAKVAALAELVGAQAVVVDTTGRALDGDENDAGPYREFAMWTGLALKRLGIALLRTDHAGKDKDKGQRGSSAKNDDVDVVFRLDVADDGYALTRTHTRVSWVPDRVAIARRENDMGEIEFVAARQAKGWPAGTASMAELLDNLNVPLDASRRAAQQILKEATGKGGKQAVVQAALNYRKSGRPERVETLGTTLGTTHTQQDGDHTGDQHGDQ